MKTFVTAAGLAMGASAAILPRNDQCCFQLTASGGPSGTLGQLSDGQNRVGGGLGAATYCINNGAITDQSGRGCILTAPTTQFQCDKGATPQSGFSVSSDGMLEYDNDTTFYACPADEGEYNIYTQPVKNQPKCSKVQLSTGGKCYGGTSSSMMSATSTCPPQQTVTEQAQASTVYVTKTEQAQASTVVKPTTVYETKTMQNTVTAEKPTIVYSTKTVEETETAKATITAYKTEYKSTTATATVTAYKTEYNTATATVTAYKTEQTTVTAEQPTTVYSTKVVEETETKQAPPQTNYVTKTVQGPGSTITKVVSSVETQQAKPSTQYITKVETQPCTQQQATVTTVMPSKPAQSAAASSCPANLNGEWQYPHLIVPMSSEHPDMSYGTSYNGMINSSMSSVYNFDIPQSYQGKTCHLVFMFPKKDQLETSGYTFNGQGSVSVGHMSGVCKASDSYSSMPKMGQHMGDFSPMPGNSYTVWSGDCPAGSTQSYEMSAMGGMEMNYFQDYNPCPLGLYMTTS